MVGTNLFSRDKEQEKSRHRFLLPAQAMLAFLVIFLGLAMLSAAWLPAQAQSERLAGGVLLLLAGLLLAGQALGVLRAQNSASKAHLFYKNLFTKAGAACMLTDHAGQIVYVNERALQLLDSGPQTDLRGRFIADFLALPGQISQISHFAPAEKEIEIATLRNRRFWARIRVQALSEYGSATYAFFITDIDKYRQEEKPVFEPNEAAGVLLPLQSPSAIHTGLPAPFYTTGSLLSFTEEATFGWDIAGGVWTYTQGFRQFMGFAALNMPEGHRFWRSRIHEQDRQRALLMLKRLLRGNQTALSESFRIRHSDGRYRWVLAQVRLIRNEAGKPKHLIGCCIDIGELKGESELLYRTFEATSSCLAALRPLRATHREITDFTFALANQATNDLLASGANILIGEQLLQIMPQCEENGMFDLMKNCFETRTTAQIERPFQVTYNRRVWLRMQAARRGDALIITLTDITPQKSHEEVFPGKKAEFSSGAKVMTDLLARMSHEVRTPLNALTGLAGLLEETELTQEQTSFVQMMRTSSDNLLHIFNDMLDYSRLNSGKLALEHQSFNLIDCIEGVYDQVSLKAEARQLELIYYIDPHVPSWIIADPGRIRQVLETLIGNAIRYTENGEIYTAVRQIGADLLTATLEFAVRDTGIGIAPEQIPHVFKSFSEAEALTTWKNDGSGLSLALCKKLVLLMGGEIWIESRQWKGSTFYFTLRVQVDPSTPPLHESLRDDNIRGARVLIVDDNETNLSILRLRCKKWGMEVVDFEDPREALEMIIDYQEEDDILPPFDLAIIDGMMPHLDGNELARSIRAFYNRETLPIIMLTSMATPPTEEEKRLYTAYLSKPVKQAQFLENIRFVLNTRSFLRKGNRYAEETLPRKALRLQPGLRVLVVEDNLINQQVAVQILSRFGYRADIAINGLEAIRSLETRRYDLVFMDVQMPEMDGLAATRVIRQRFPDEQRPLVIAMTANVLKGDREACLEAGMNDYISKPVQLHDIEQAIARWFPAMEVRENE